MIVQRFNPSKRSKFIIITADIFKLEIHKLLPEYSNDLEYIKNMLTFYLKNKLADLPPVHYIVNADGYIENKNIYLKHSSNNYLKAFDDDVVIMVAVDSLDQINNKHMDICSDIVSKVSEQFALEIKDNVFFPEASRALSYSKAIKIELDSVKKRNDRNPFFNILEYIQGESVVQNSNIVLAKAGDFKNNIEHVANRYLISKNYLKELNIHLDTDNLIDSDILILPRIVSVYASKTASNIGKMCQFYKDVCDDIVNSREEV